MTFFPNTARPASSPWGSIQQADRLAAGIWSVMTASHGGILLSDERQEAMPEALRRSTTNRLQAQVPVPDTFWYSTVQQGHGRQLRRQIYTVKVRELTSLPV